MPCITLMVPPAPGDTPLRSRQSRRHHAPAGRDDPQPKTGNQIVPEERKEQECRRPGRHPSVPGDGHREPCYKRPMRSMVTPL